MKLELSYGASELDELQLRDKNIIVVDVLRASTTIALALKNGAREIIPVASIESAVKISGSLFGDVTLRGGERSGKMIQGFNLGNSPLEYTESTVRGKSIIYCTTNGSVAMSKSRYARTMAVGSFVNLSVIVDYMKEVNDDFLIICAGQNGGFSSFSLEDAVCAGMIISRLNQDKTLNVQLTDAAISALTLHKSFGRSILKMMKNSDHGRYLMELGFAEDIKFCSTVDAVPVLPVQSGTVIRLRKDEPKPMAAEASGTSTNSV